MMKKLKITFKATVSIAYRILLVIFAISILYTKDNILPLSAYTIIILAYLSGYFFLKRKSSEWYSLFRLILDYTFIFSILFGKSANDLLNICFFITPIINSSNYTGKFSVIASLRLYGAAFIVLLLLFNFRINFSWLVPLIIFWILNIASKVREYLTNFELFLSAPITEHEETATYATNKYQVLGAIIKRFNEDEWLKKLCPQIKNISCFRVEREKQQLKVVSSSVLINSFKFETFFESLKDERIPFECIINADFEINGDKNINGNFIKFVATKDNLYMFCVEFCDGQIKTFLQYVSKLFLFTFNQLAKIFDLDAFIKQKRTSLLSNIRQQVLFIEQSTNVIHFVNNKLTPVDNYFTLKNDIAKGYIVPNKEIIALLEQEERNSKRNIGVIKARCSRQLNKSANPLYVGQKEVIEYRQLAIFIKSIWMDAGLDSARFHIDLAENESTLKFSVEMESLEIVLDELFQNITKYSKSEYLANLIATDIGLVIELLNDFDSQYADRIRLLSFQFNQPELSEVLKRKSYGMGMIKSFLMQMGINSKIEVKDKNFLLSLSLQNTLE